MGTRSLYWVLDAEASPVCPSFIQKQEGLNSKEQLLLLTKRETESRLAVKLGTCITFLNLKVDGVEICMLPIPI